MTKRRNVFATSRIGMSLLQPAALYLLRYLALCVLVHVSEWWWWWWGKGFFFECIEPNLTSR